MAAVFSAFWVVVVVHLVGEFSIIGALVGGAAIACWCFLLAIWVRPHWFTTENPLTQPEFEKAIIEFRAANGYCLKDLA